MELIWKTCTIVLLFSLTGQKLSHAQTSCPTMEDTIEPIVFIDSDTEKQELRQTRNIEKHVKESVPGNDSDEIIEALNMANITKHVNATPDDIKLVGNASPGSATDLDFGRSHYHDICPYKWYLMRKYWWYWWTWKRSNSVTTIRYCFTYWWVWATRCTQHICLTHYYPFELHSWDLRFRCFPVYRIIWLPVVCYEYKITPTPRVGRDGRAVYGYGLWKKWTWKKVYVPRGCCCMRFWHWLTFKAGKCPAEYSPDD